MTPFKDFGLIFNPMPWLDTYISGNTVGAALSISDSDFLVNIASSSFPPESRIKIMRTTAHETRLVPPGPLLSRKVSDFSPVGRYVDFVKLDKERG